MKASVIAFIDVLLVQLTKTVVGIYIIAAVEHQAESTVSRILLKRLSGSYLISNCRHRFSIFAL